MSNLQSVLRDGLPPRRGSWRPSSAETGSRSCRIPVDELLTSRFLARHTSFSSFAALFAASGLSPEQFSDLEERTDSCWEQFIQRSSGFSGWSAMLREARGEWFMRRLGIVVDV